MHFIKILMFSKQNKTDHHFLRDWNCVYNIYVALLSHFRWNGEHEYSNTNNSNLNGKFHAKNLMKFWVLMRIWVRRSYLIDIDQINNRFIMSHRCKFENTYLKWSKHPFLENIWSLLITLNNIFFMILLLSFSLLCIENKTQNVF